MGEKNTEGRVLRVCNIYEEIKKNTTTREGLKEIKDTFHDTPSLWNISSSVLNATGFTRLLYKVSSEWTRKENRRVAHYPSTPASNALLLSSRDDIPVRANIRVRVEAPVVIC